MEKTLREIAALVDGNILGEAELVVTGVTNIDNAGPGDITFAVEPHIAQAEVCRAGAVIVPRAVEVFAKPAIRVDNPRAAFAKLLEVFTPPLKMERGVHPTAILGENVKVGNNVAILPYAVVADDAVIGDNVVLYPHTYVGQGVSIGDDTILYSSVTVREFCQLGRRVVIHSSTVIGSDGFGFITTKAGHEKVPQVGNVVIEDDVEIGAHVGIDRATSGSTVVKRGTKIDNLVHLGHNCVIGEHGIIVALTGLSGSTIVGDWVTFAGQCGTKGHLEIGDHCVFAARSGITADVTAGSFCGGFPARSHKDWLRGEAYQRKVPDLLKKVKELEKRLAELERAKP